MRVEGLIGYYNKRMGYLLEELRNLATIYKERSDEFTLDEAATHRNMTERYRKQLEMVQATVEILEGLDEYTRKID